MKIYCVAVDHSKENDVIIAWYDYLKLLELAERYGWNPSPYIDKDIPWRKVKWCIGSYLKDEVVIAQKDTWAMAKALEAALGDIPLEPMAIEPIVEWSPSTELYTDWILRENKCLQESNPLNWFSGPRRRTIETMIVFFKKGRCQFLPHSDSFVIGTDSCLYGEHHS